MRVATAPEFEILAKRLGKVYRLARRDVDRFMDDTVMLLLIWSKAQVSDIPDDVIRRVANQY